MTTTCHEFLPLIEPKEMKDMLLANFQFYNKKHDAEIVAYVLMPEHLHILIYFRNDNQLIDYLRNFKSFTAKKILEYWKKTNPSVLEKLTHWTNGQQQKVWMDRFDDVFLYTPRICWIKLRYINNNPVKRGLCKYADQYIYSSARFYNGQADEKIALTNLHDLL